MTMRNGKPNFRAGNPEAVCAWNLEAVGRTNRDRMNDSWTTNQSSRGHPPHSDRMNESGTHRLVSKRAVDE